MLFFISKILFYSKILISIQKINKQPKNHNNKSSMIEKQSQIKKPMSQLHSISDQDHANHMFDSPLHTPNQQSLRLKRFYKQSEIPDFQNNDPIQNYLVHDRMTIKQLRDQWFQQNYKNKQQELENGVTSQRFVLMWEMEFPLYEHYTMAEIKKKIQKQRFDNTSIIRVYWQWDCPYQQDQAALNYIIFQQKHNGQKIQLTMKISSSDQDKNIYFYLQLKFGATFNDLIKKIDAYFTDKNSQINYNPLFSYRIFLHKQSFTTQQYKNIIKQFIINNTYHQQKDNKLYFLDSFFKIRDICSPGQIIYIDLEKPQQCKINNQEKWEYNPDIQIVCYKEDLKAKDGIAEEKQKEGEGKIIQADNILDIRQKVFKRKYFQIRNVKVNTVLKQQNVIDSLVTSLYCNQTIIKPFQLFKQLDKLILSKNNKQQPLKLICIPQNVLYYRELQTMQNTGYNKTMKQLLQDIIIKNKSLETNRQVYRKKREKIINSDKIDNQHKDQNMLDPLLLYTGPSLYKQLNRFLRQTSVSLFESDKLVKQSWHYPFCQKLNKSLLKLKNYQGKVYRGSINFQYCYRQGQIIEWNCFNSTSSKKQKGLQFVLKQAAPIHPYLFQIETYSGKEIQQYSYYAIQSEILIMPYTRFRVKKVLRNFKQYNQQKTRQVLLTYVQLIQLPIPKKIPGNIVVWIDSNIGENSKAFNKIVKINKLQDFDLIQVVSNQQFKQWLNQYKNLLSLPEARIHFISNMNRPPNYAQEGIQTLRIIRSFRPHATVVYYIGDVQKTLNYIKQTQYAQDPNLQVVRTLKDLQKVFLTKLLKPKQQAKYVT